MAKTCGKCKWFSKTDGDMDANEYPDGGDWGFCHAPVPMSVEDVGGGTVDANQRAKDCDTYKKRRK